MLALVLAVVPACSPRAPDAAPDLAGASVEVVAVWTGTEQARFEQVLAEFGRRTGARVTYVSTGGEDIAAVLDDRLAAGDPPDVAILPQPGLLARYARDGAVLPLGDEVAAEVEQRYAAVWRRLASVDGRLYGVWFKAANKSLVWYHVGTFEQAGVVPPTSLDGLSEVASALAAAGTPPFSVAAAPSDAWTLTDWFENLYLRIAGPEGYDALAEHRRPWTHPTVLETLERFRGLLSPPHLAGGVAGALATTFPESVDAVFVPTDPAAAMVVEGDFVPGVAAGVGTGGAEVGVEVDVVPFPELRPADRLVVGGGDAAVLMRPTEAGQALVRFLATPGAAEVWAALGGFVSPNEDVDLRAYPDETTRGIARALLEAGDGFRFDLSDLQPVAFGGTTGAGMWGLLRDLVAGARGVAETAALLETARA